MSGGSYNYLCHATAEDLLQRESDLVDMLERLQGLDYATEAAEATGQIQASLSILKRQFEILNLRVEDLSNVWRAVEWWDSNDVGEEDVKKVMKHYEIRTKVNENMKKAFNAQFGG